MAEFVAKDGARVALRAPKMSDLDAFTRFANRIAKEKRVNRELGVVSFDRRVTRKGEGEFLKATVEGLRRGEVLSVAAFVDGEVVGHCDVRRRKPKDFHHAGVLGIVIQDGFRDRGVGRRMMGAVMDRSRKAGVWLLELTVFATNGRAIHLYEELGFERLGSVPDKILRDGRYVDEVIMAADLRGSAKSPSGGRGKG